MLKYRERLRLLGFFTEGKQDLSFKFKKKLSENQIAELAEILAELAKDIEAKGDKVPDSAK